MPTIITEHFLPALSWTFVHSLWQGVVAAAVAAMIIMLTRKRSAALRYRLICITFFLFIAGTAAGFIREWISSYETPANLTVANTGTSRFFAWQMFVEIDRFVQLNANWIVAAWSIVFLLRVTKLLLDMSYMKHLRRHQILSPGNFWNIRIQELAERTGIRKKILLLESTLVKVPMVAGHFKPVILLPAGILTHLHPDELEAILLHELAHIRRHDYLVNVIQRLAELVFFFNPGLLWISSLLRVERENCCDDIAISRTQNKIAFVEALLGCKEYSLIAPGYALGLFGSKNLLLKRMTRIASGDNRTLGTPEAIFFALNLMIACLLFFTFGNARTRPGDNSTSAYSAPALALLHSAGPIHLEPEKKIASVTIQKTETSKITKRVTKRKQVQSPGKIVAAIDNAQEVTIQITTSTSREEKAEDPRERMDKDRHQSEKDREQASKDREQAIKDRAQAELDRLQAAKDRIQAGLERQQATRDRLTITLIPK